MNKSCAARLPSGEVCGKPATCPDRELRDVVCSECTRRLNRGRWRRSYHEAGRAIALDQLGVRLTQVSLHAPGLSSPRRSSALVGHFSAEERCLFLLAGSVAEEIGVDIHALGELDPPLDDLDLAYARSYVRGLVRDDRAADAYLAVVRQGVVRLLADRRVEVNALATALFERLRLNAEETDALLATGTTPG